ncbi:hypothetical protein CIY_34770 [Butyrivibrio fibrisolvens 16/4]|nr:hypothetical protein CIY_34770 [Butyrivibrio fibrisolvens 16/4]
MRKKELALIVIDRLKKNIHIVIVPWIMTMPGSCWFL